MIGTAVLIAFQRNFPRKRFRTQSESIQNGSFFPDSNSIWTRPASDLRREIR